MLFCRKRAALVLFVFALTPILRAQSQNGEVRVAVSDSSGLPLPSTVSLSSQASRTHVTAKTFADGHFDFEHLPYGLYQVSVEHSGFQPSTRVVDVRSSIPQTVNVQLTIQGTSTEVEVKADATLVNPNQTGMRNFIDGREIQEQASPIPGRGVLDLIDMQPGWLFEANGVLHPRGSEYQTQFVVDGMPMEENRSPAFAPQLQTNDVSSMTVLTGDYPAEYGRKLGGIIEVNTEREIEAGWHGSVDTGVGSFDMGTGSVVASYGWTNTSVTLEADASRTNRYLDPPVLGNYTNAGSAERFAISADENLSLYDRLHVSVHRSDARFEVPNENLQEAAGQLQNRDAPEDTGQIGWDHVFSANSVLATRAYVEDLSANLWSNAMSTPIIASQQRGFRRSYLNTTLSVHHAKHELKFGADAFYSPVTERLQYQITEPSYFDPGTPLSFSFFDHRLDREQALFAQDKMQYGNLTVTAGLRFDHYSFVARDHAFSPRLGVAYYFPKLALVLHASYDRVFQTPATENLLLASSSEVTSLNDQVLRLPVKPSRGNFVDLGFTQGLFGKLKLDASFYRRTFQNFADDDVFLNTGISFPIAFQSAQIRGVDAKLDIPQWGHFSGFLSYSNMLGVAQLPVTGGFFLGNDAAGVLGSNSSFPITQDQRNTARARVRYQLTPRIWTAAEAEYGSGLPVDISLPADIPSLVSEYGTAILNQVNFAAGRVRPNFSLNLSAGADLWKRETALLRAEVEADNITDRLNVIDFAGLFSGTAIGLPRAFTGRLQFQF